MMIIPELTFREWAQKVQIKDRYGRCLVGGGQGFIIDQIWEMMQRKESMMMSEIIKQLIAR